MASENDRHEAYKNYIAANESTVLKGLKNWLLFGRPIAEASILYEIRKCLDPWPTHFILENSQSRKVRDGDLLENGYICKNLTIKDFLNEFSGKVFLCEGENGYDEYYTTYGEELDISIGSVIEKMAKKGMEAILKDKFKSYDAASLCSLAPSPQGLTNDDEVGVQSANGASDSHVRIQLPSDRWANKFDRGFPSVDENMQDEGVFMECLFKVVDIYSALSVIRFYRMEEITLNDIR